MITDSAAPERAHRYATAMLPAVRITAADGREHRVAGFLRLRASGGIIDAARRIPAGTTVWWQGQRMRVDQ